MLKKDIKKLIRLRDLKRVSEFRKERPKKLSIEICRYCGKRFKYHGAAELHLFFEHKQSLKKEYNL